MTPPEPYEAVVLARIAELLRHRRWWRENRWADWPEERRDTERELRALVRLARQARRLAARKPDPVTAAKAWQDGADTYHDWQAQG